MAGSPQEWADGAAVRLDRKDPYLRLQSITIFVRDLDRSLDFYMGQLGFQLVFDARSQQFANRRFVTVAPPDGSANLTLVAPERDSEQHKRTPLIIISTDGREADRDRGLKLGANAYLTKPFSPEELLATANKLLGGG